MPDCRNGGPGNAFQPTLTLSETRLFMSLICQPGMLSPCHFHALCDSIIICYNDNNIDNFFACKSATSVASCETVCEVLFVLFWLLRNN